MIDKDNSFQIKTTFTKIFLFVDYVFLLFCKKDKVLLVLFYLSKNLIQVNKQKINSITANKHIYSEIF